MTLLDEATLPTHLAALADADPAFARAFARIGPPRMRVWEPGFSTIVDIIMGQQVSTASARAIRAKLSAAFDPLTPEALAAAEPEALRACGLSRQKIAYVGDLARRIVDGRLALDRLPGMEDEAAVAELTAVKGLGRWSAEIYLLFALGRGDVWPAEDMALQEAVRHLRGLPDRPKGRAARDAAEPWRPWRGAAAHFCWHLYHHLSGRAGTQSLAPANGETPL